MSLKSKNKKLEEKLTVFQNGKFSIIVMSVNGVEDAVKGTEGWYKVIFIFLSFVDQFN